MKSVKERNDLAMERIRKSFQDLLKSPVAITLQDLNEFVDCSLEFHDKLPDTEGKGGYAITMFLLAEVDWSNPGEPSNIMPRYKTFKDGGITIAIRDWYNRFKIGK